MDFFWKRKKQPRMIMIPPARVEDFYVLMDNFSRSNELTHKYKMWVWLCDLFPEVEEGNWTVVTSDIFHPYLIEIL